MSDLTVDEWMKIADLPPDRDDPPEWSIDDEGPAESIQADQEDANEPWGFDWDLHD